MSDTANAPVKEETVWVVSIKGQWALAPDRRAHPLKNAGPYREIPKSMWEEYDQTVKKSEQLFRAIDKFKKSVT